MPPNVAYGYFGSLTRMAVASWQEANGITPAVGFFGPISRAVIVSQIGSVVTSSITSTSSTFPVSVSVPAELFSNAETDAPTAPGMKAGRVMLFRAFPFEVRPGDPITLDGSGFSRTLNKVYFNGDSPDIATSTDGVTLEVSVPARLAEGEYKLTVSNVWGSSENPSITVLIKVTNSPHAAPTIESASIAADDTITLVGSGFTSANNIITTLGNSSHPISASGDTLIFRVADLSMYNETRAFTLGKYQEVLWIYVQNEHGANKEPYQLEITI